MTEICESLNQKAGALLAVLYSMTLEEPRSLQGVGLNFARSAVTFRASATAILVQRSRLCGSGVCEESEACFLADVTPRWAALLGTTVARAKTHVDDRGRIKRVRLEFDGEKPQAVEILLEAGFLSVDHL